MKTTTKIYALLASFALSTASGLAQGEATGAQELAERIGGGCKAAGYLYAQAAQCTDHLAKRRVLATHLVEISKTQVFKFLCVVLQRDNLVVLR